LQAAILERDYIGHQLPRPLRDERIVANGKATAIEAIAEFCCPLLMKWWNSPDSTRFQS
jgi:hypothetical protein